MSSLLLSFRISRVTIFSLLLALLLTTGIRRWYLGRRDDCARYLAGDTSLPSAQVVVSGTRTIVVPCDQWWLRQPTIVQMLCLLDLLLAAVFVVNGLQDTRAWIERRRGNAQARVT
jgi:hypothetical protein